MKVVDKLGRFDGLDLANLAGAEVAFRRLQLIEYAYSERGPGGGKGAPKGDKKADGFSAVQQYEATIFAGAHKEYGRHYGGAQPAGVRRQGSGRRGFGHEAGSKGP